jgi:tRNA nucleotidyltransferase (CCA-adding enzyme)
MVNFKISQQHVNPQAIEVCRILRSAGHQAFVVGGCVRDLLIDIKPKDWDICTDAGPQQVMDLFPKHYPTGLQHGTITVAMGEGVENHFEVTTFRIEGEYKDGRRPEEVFFVANVEQDLARRDLTINAIAYDPIDNRLIDPYNGINDLQNQIVRAVGIPEARFKEDGLRIMRAARFAARFGCIVADKTFAGMKASLETLKLVSKERIQDELSKTLMTNNPAYGIKLLHDSGALQIACPLLTSSPSLMHFSSELDNCMGDLETRLALLYGNCKTALAVEELTTLKFSNKEIKRVGFLLDLLDKFETFQRKDSALAYKSFMAVIKNHSPDPWKHTLEQFIQLTEAMGFESRALFLKYEHVIVWTKKELQINGDNLLNIGVKPGPQIKKILDECYLEILRNPENNNRNFLLDFAAVSTLLV